MKLRWHDRLKQTLQQLPRLHDQPRIAIVGIGNELRGDDAAGLMAVDGLHSTEQVAIIRAEAVPESFAGYLCDFHPDLTLFIDAVQMNQPPGTIDWVDNESITGLSASSHTLPLSILAKYLILETGCQVALIGIQPGGTELGAPLCPEVQNAVGDLIDQFTGLLAQIG